MSNATEHEGTLVDVLDPAAPEMDPTEIAESAAALQRLPPDTGLTLSGPGGSSVPLPSEVVHVIASILQEAARGHVVAVLSTAEEVGTGTAARMLGVSRPHVAKLIDAKLLPGRRVRKHRRVRMTDLLAFKREMERKNALLDEIAEEAEVMGLHDAAPGPRKQHPGRSAPRGTERP